MEVTTANPELFFIQPGSQLLWGQQSHCISEDGSWKETKMTPKAPHANAGLSLVLLGWAWSCWDGFLRHAGLQVTHSQQSDQQAAKPCCCPQLQLWHPPEAQGSCSTTKPPSNSVNPWTFLQGYLGSSFLPFIYSLLLQEHSICEHVPALGSPAHSEHQLCSELCLLVHFLGMQIFANEKCSLTLWIQFIFVEIRESGNVTQWWHYSYSENSKTHWNTISCVFSFSAGSWWEEEHRLQAHSKCLSFPCTFSKGRNVYQKEAGDFPFFHLIFKANQTFSSFKKNLQWKQQSTNYRYIKILPFFFCFPANVGETLQMVQLPGV